MITDVLSQEYEDGVIKLVDYQLIEYFLPVSISVFKWHVFYQLGQMKHGENGQESDDCHNLGLLIQEE